MRFLLIENVSNSFTLSSGAKRGDEDQCAYPLVSAHRYDGSGVGMRREHDRSLGSRYGPVEGCHIFGQRG